MKRKAFLSIFIAIGLFSIPVISPLKYSFASEIVDTDIVYTNYSFVKKY